MQYIPYDVIINNVVVLWSVVQKDVLWKTFILQYSLASFSDFNCYKYLAIK